MYRVHEGIHELGPERWSKSGGVGAVVRSLPSNPKVPGSIPGSVESADFSACNFTK